MPDEGLVRGAVVLCPPFGLEAQAVVRAYQALGDELARRGFGAIQIDYDGTGDSAGSSQDPQRMAAWQGSLLRAIQLVRAGGARHVSVVAMRLGATVAASVAGRCALDALVLWDPCFSGRSFLREQVLLRSVYMEQERIVRGPTMGPDEAQGQVETLGAVYGAETARAVSELTIEAAGGVLARDVLALFRSERPPPRAALERLSRERLEVAEAAGQEELLSVWPLRSVLPQQAIGTVVAWLDRMSGAEVAPLAIRCSQTASVAEPSGSEIAEEIVSLGPARLFGIVTKPRLPRTAVTAILLNAGRLDHVGPGRLWVDLARSWARAGMTAVRVDLSGLGDSPTRECREAGVVYSPDAVRDICDIARSLPRKDGSGVVLAGLCSGAYHAVIAASVVPSSAVLAINPIFPGTEQPVALRKAGPRTSGAITKRAQHALEAAKHLGSLVPGYPTLKPVGRWAMDARWWAAGRTGRRARPALALEQALAGGASALLACRPYEARLIARGERAAFRRMLSSGQLDLRVFADIDHSLYLQGGRDEVVPVLTEYIMTFISADTAG